MAVDSQLPHSTPTESVVAKVSVGYSIDPTLDDNPSLQVPEAVKPLLTWIPKRPRDSR
jgi:hypothetical protein